MGVFYTMSAAPRRPDLPDGERFAALLADLVARHVVTFPAYVLTGTLHQGAGPYSIGTVAGQPLTSPSLTGRDFDLTVRYTGSDPDHLLSAARTASIGSEDVCVYFISRYYPPPAGEPPDSMTGCDAGLFATREPRTLTNEEPFALLSDGTLASYDADEPDADPVHVFPAEPSHHARWFLALEGESAPWDLLPAALPVCTRHFGANHFAGCLLS